MFKANVEIELCIDKDNHEHTYIKITNYDEDELIDITIKQMLRLSCVFNIAISFE